jgi:hypothetical protein
MQEIGAFLDSVLAADHEALRARFVAAPPRPAAAGFQWPWDIASAGARNLRDHTGAAEALASGARAVADSAQGPGIVAAVAASPGNSGATDQVLNNGLFTSAINNVRADQLLRTMYIGWAGGAQVGIFGGGGGTGVAYDIVDRSNRAAVGYGMFKLGIGAQVSTGLLVGAMTRDPGSLRDSTAVFEFGASLIGVGALVQVIMSDNDLSLIGFTLNVGVGAGFSSATGYGSIGPV